MAGGEGRRSVYVGRGEGASLKKKKGGRGGHKISTYVEGRENMENE